MEWGLINSEFDHIKDTTYLNICSIGPIPKSVKDAQVRFIENRVDPYGKDVMDVGRELIKKTKLELGKLINCHRDEIGMTTSTASGMGIFIGGYPFKYGDNIIVSDQEFPSAILGFIPLKEKGVEIKTIKPKNGYLDIEDYKNNIDENTKAIVVSAVQFTNGFYIDLVRLGALCKMYNIHLVVDGIQGIGRLNIDVEKMNISFLSCGGFKGLLSSVGIGFIYCKRDLIEDIKPIAASYTNVKYKLEPPHMNYDIDNTVWFDGCRRYEAGHINYLGVAGLHEACKLINTIGIVNIEEHILSLQLKLLDDIKELNFRYMTPEIVENYSGIFSIYFPIVKFQEVKGIMEKYNIIASLYESGYMRIGIGFYNTIKDIEKLVIALEEIASIL